MDGLGLPKGRSRRCFPAVDVNRKAIPPNSEATTNFLFYSTQVDRYREKKDRFNTVIPLISDALHSDNSNEATPIEPAISPERLTVVDENKELPITIDDEEPPFNADDEAVIFKSPIEIDLKTSKRAKKRQKKTNQLLNQLDKVITNCQSSPVFNDSLTEDLEPVGLDDISADTLVIRIKWKREIYRFQLKMNEPFHKMLPEVTEVLEIPADKVILILRGDFLNLFDTPLKVDFKRGEVIECLTQVEENLAEVANPDIIEVKLQSTNDKRKISMKCHKLQPLLKLLEEYAKLKDIDASKLQIHFDGENVDLEETAADLDLEDGDCLDIIAAN